MLAGLLLTGCASSRATPTSATAPAGQHTGSTAEPSAAALMICSDDIRGKVRQALALPAPPAATDSFVSGRYTCTYRLPAGPLALAVQQSPDHAAASRYYAGQQLALRGDDLPGLGEAAFGTGTGIVVVVKDDATLTVDATGLPAVFGPQQQRRTDLAYEIASDVLGCWTGDDS
jgi:hypothetical protein